MTYAVKNPQQLTILIVNHHHLLLNGTINLVREHFGKAQIDSAQSRQEVLAKIQERLPDLIIVDLLLPQTSGEQARVEYGLDLLRQLMQNYPQVNFMVQSSKIKALIRLIPEIDNHRGGFTIADNSLPITTLVTRIDWAMQGLTYTKDIKSDLEVKPEWLEVLRLAFEEGLQDKAIAQAMYKSERMIRHYWSKIQGALQIYSEEGKNIRALTQICARQQGLID